MPPLADGASSRTMHERDGELEADLRRQGLHIATSRVLVGGASEEEAEDRRCDRSGAESEGVRQGKECTMPAWLVLLPCMVAAWACHAATHAFHHPLEIL